MAADSSACTSAVFATFYDQAAPEVFRYLNRAVFGDRATAEDLTQETFAAVVVAARAGRAEALSMPWVMGIARHKLIDHYRRSSRDERHLAVIWARTHDDDDLTGLDGTEPGQVLAMMRRLTPAHRLVLMLRYVDDLAVQEIAVAMNRSLHATNSLLCRARRALLSSLTENPS